MNCRINEDWLHFIGRWLNRAFLAVPADRVLPAVREAVEKLGIDHGIEGKSRSAKVVVDNVIEVKVSYKMADRIRLDGVEQDDRALHLKVYQEGKLRYSNTSAVYYGRCPVLLVEDVDYGTAHN